MTKPAPVRKSNLGDSKPLNPLAYLTLPGPAMEPRPLMEVPLVEAPDQPKRPIVLPKPQDPPREPEPPMPEVEELIQLNLPVPPRVAMRFYSVVAHDPEMRTIKEIGLELLEEALAKRPDKGPAPPSFMKRLKSYGKRKKS